MKNYDIHWQPKKHNKIQRGFTLLEMLLLIIILASVITYSTSLFKSQQNQNAVDKTATEMLQLLQAAQAYYRDSPNSYWPDDIYALERGPYKGLTRCGPLVLSTTEKDSYNCGYHNLYQLSFPEATGSGNPNISPAPKSSTLMISTVAPSLAVAKAIAAKVPYGEVDTKNNTVSTYVYAPGHAQIGDLGQIMANQKVMMVKTVYTDLIGKDESQQALANNMSSSRYLTLTLPDCPTNWTPGYDTALNQFVENKNSSSAWVGGAYICKTQYSFTPADIKKQARLTARVPRYFSKTISQSDFYSASVLIITYCRPPTISNANAWNSSYMCKINTNADGCYFGGFKNDAADLPAANQTCR